MKKKKPVPFWKKITFYMKLYASKVIYKSGFDIYTDLSKFKGTYQQPPYKHPYGEEWVGIDPTNYLPGYENETIYKRIS